MVGFAFQETVVEMILCLLLRAEMIGEVRNVNLQNVCFAFMSVTDALWSFTVEENGCGDLQP